MVGDSDALIAILHRHDAHFEVARTTLQTIVNRQFLLVFPITTVIETITAIHRKLQDPDLVQRVIDRIEQGGMALEPVDADLYRDALTIFNPSGSKNNTLFDAVVAATANRYRAKYIFSFDRWYEKLGFTLAKDL